MRSTGLATTTTSAAGHYVSAIVSARLLNDVARVQEGCPLLFGLRAHPTTVVAWARARAAQARATLPPSRPTPRIAHALAASLRELRGSCRLSIEAVGQDRWHSLGASLLHSPSGRVGLSGPERAPSPGPRARPSRKREGANLISPIRTPIRGFTALQLGKLVPHLLPLGLQIALVVFVDRGNDRHLVDDAQDRSRAS